MHFLKKRFQLITIILVAFFIAHPVAPLLAQNLKLSFQRISNEQGLSNSTIETIFQDSRGFIWFGTRDGLNCYDGYQIKIYRNKPGDSGSISDNYIKYIYEDKQKVLWIGTINGLNRFNARTNSFVRFKHDLKNKNSLSHNDITCIYEDRKGNFWIGTYGGGLNRMNRKNNTFLHYRHQQKLNFSLSSDFVNDLEEGNNGNLWLATNKGLCLFNANTQTFERVPYKKNGRETINLKLIATDKDKQLWLGTNDQGILHYNPSTNSFKKYQHTETDFGSLGSNLVRSLLIDKKGNLWVGGINGGLNLFNPANQSFYNYHDEPNNPESLSQRTISALFEDNQGNLWVGTHRGGVNVYMPKAQKFKVYRKELSANSLSYNDVKSFCEDNKGNIWIGTDGGGLNLFNQTTNSFKHFRYNPYNTSSLGSDAVLHVMQDKQSNIWVGTWGGGLNLFNPQTGNFKRYVNDPQNSESISSNYVQQVFEDSRNNLWIATYFGGLNLFDRKTQTFNRLINGSQKSSLKGNNIVSIAEDKQSNIWIGTDDGGLNCYNLNTKRFTHYFVNAEKMPDIRVIFHDSKNSLWIGQAGLYKFNPAKNAFYLFTTKAGLSTEFIKGITEDNKGNLWISTSNGLSHLNPKTLEIKKYNPGDGLQSLEFEANAYLKTSKGIMFFGGVNGFNTFKPDNIKLNTFIPPVYLTSFQIFNKEVIPGLKDSPLKTDISFTKEVELSYKESSISFSFSALNYTTPRNNHYAYKLEGFDKNWIHIGPSRRAQYTNLDPGEYTFKVIASNNDGIWNTKGTSVKIKIHPPFWDTWWFQLLLVAAILGSAYKYLSYRRQQELKELEEKKREEVQQLQLQFFTNISHEFRTPLSLILGPLEKLLQEDSHNGFRHYHTVMFRNANRLMGLINELMDFRKIESGALKLKVMPGNLNSFIEEIADDFKDVADERHIDYQLSLDLNQEVWFDRQVLEKIVLNLINNSFKYTADKGFIHIDVFTGMGEYKPRYENTLFLKSDYPGKNFVYIRVTDNGIGISKDSIQHLFQRYYRITDTHLGSGVGLAFVKSLTFLHKGRIFVSSEKNKGTEITIAVPYNKEDYRVEERWIKDSEGDVKLESLQYRTNSELKPQKEREILHNERKEAIQKHLLIVDDNDELRNFLKDSLGENYKISEAENGRAGLEKAKEVLPDLIISDVMMPDMDGIEFCRLVKDDIEISHIPFLMLTAKNTLESEIEGVESGADFYFSKPISINLLILTIRNIFGQKQKLIDHYNRDHHAEVKELVHSTKDKEFMDRLLAIIDSQLINPDLDIEFLCAEIGMSRTKLYQKIKSITGQPIGEFIRTMRLRKAIELMTHDDLPLTEVMYQVGIQTQSYFTKAFKKEFGKTPTQFLQELQKN